MNSIEWTARILTESLPLLRIKLPKADKHQRDRARKSIFEVKVHATANR